MSTAIIDSHQHFINPGKIDYCWMTPDMPLAKDFMPGDLEPVLKANGVAKTVLVEAADSEEENVFMMDLARENDFIAGVVIWLDMESPQFEAELKRYLENPKFVGIRPMIESIPDDAWMLKPSVKKAFGKLEAHGVCFDFLTHPRHMPYAIEILNEFPNLRTVINHISKPKIKDGLFQPWAELMAEIASHSNVFCKLSGMITEADHDGWKPEDLTPYIEHVLKLFGPERCMFGSDWPVCLLAGSYESVLSALRRNLGGLGDADLERIFGGTAKEFYRLHE